MKVFGNRVLVEQIVKRRETNVLLPGGKKAEPEVSATFNVIGIGSKVEEIQIGDIPIFGKHVTFHGVKVVSKSAHENISTEILHVIVYDEDILGADDPIPAPESIEVASEEKSENQIKE